VQSDGVNRQTFSQLMQDPEILGAARHSIDYVPRLARKMPVSGMFTTMGHTRASTDEVHFYLSPGIATGANSDVLVTAFFS
jgi:hypothetical protein